MLLVLSDCCDTIVFVIVSAIGKYPTGTAQVINLTCVYS